MSIASVFDSRLPIPDNWTRREPPASFRKSMSTLAHLLVDLLSTAPGLVPIYREHLALHDALLPEVFMAQVAGWMSGTMRAPGHQTIEGGAGGEAARTLVGVFETHLTSGDADVRDLISFSLLDSIEASPANEVLRLHFGPSLRAVAARRDGWNPETLVD